ncbi:MAG: hypothetical protein K0Q91_1902 [Fibrobacteria bacterium]|nr:hypothetical protein [Fibrobacteria bacterium]
MKRILPLILFLVSLGWSDGWVKSKNLKLLQCYSSGICLFKTMEIDSTHYWLDASSESGKNMLLLLLTAKSTWTPFQFYDTDSLLPGTTHRRADAIGIGTTDE